MNTQEFDHNRDQWFAGSDRWSPLPCPVVRRKLVLLVPHPDDEIFGCAGLLQQWVPLASETLIVYVTSGEKSHGSDGDRLREARLAEIRREESRRAIEALHLDTDIRFKELNLPDSEVRSCQDQLEDMLRSELDSSCVVIAPYFQDGHTDHDAVGECANRLAHSIGFEIYFYPIWMWFWSQPTEGAAKKSFQTLPMTESEGRNKNQAIACFKSQIDSDGTREAVLPKEFLKHYQSSPFEVLMVH